MKIPSHPYNTTEPTIPGEGDVPAGSITSRAATALPFQQLPQLSGFKCRPKFHSRGYRRQASRA